MLDLKLINVSKRCTMWLLCVFWRQMTALQQVLWVPQDFVRSHYDDVIMTTMASQITSLMVVYSTVYSDADQRKHQSSASLAFVWGIHRDRWFPRTKGQLRGKCFHLMTSSCHRSFWTMSSDQHIWYQITTCHRKSRRKYVKLCSYHLAYWWMA